VAELAGDKSRKTGVVKRASGEFGFIESEAAAGRDVYFKAKWFRGFPPLQEGDEVSFELKVYQAGPQAHNLERVGGAPAAVGVGPPASGRLLDWAYLGYLPQVGLSPI
jgi:cold shock CspA family protein